MRIVGGRHRGRVLPGPRGARVRPTSDRVRGAIFNILAHGIDDFRIEGARAIDLFAGTGALGLEALSRGASFCLFVETDPPARALIRASIDALGVSQCADIAAKSATRLPAVAGREPFGLAFLDPPYAKGYGEQALAALSAGGWLVPGALVVLEERRSVPLRPPRGFDVLDVRHWGDTQVLFARYAGD